MMPTRDDDFDAENNNFSGINSNDGINNNLSSSSRLSQNPTGLSKAELRKSNKPIMEKRRRARINQSLNKMKSLMLEAMKKDPARHTKLEKADILEMTVKYLQSVQRQQLSMAIQSDPTVVHKFKAGFTECAEEVIRYVSTLDGVETGVKARLANHLNSCAAGLEQIGTFSSFTAGYRSNSSAFASQFPATASHAASSAFPLPQDMNNNGRIQMGGVQLIPSRLPSGEIALIMPNSTNIPFFPATIPTAQNLDFSSPFSRSSAFSKPSVIGGHRPSTHTATSSSPPLSPISSISSCGDDSMHTSSDFHVKTPPLSQSLSSSFETPPSAEPYKFVSLTGHLQQQHVSSTSELQKDPLREAKKRIHTDDERFQGPQKKAKLDYSGKNENLTKEDQNAEEGNSDMWRPW